MSVQPMVGLAPVAEQQERGARSPFQAARLARRLSVDDAARRAGIPADHVRWLEEARVYRFPSTEAALAAALVLAAALEVDVRKARSLAGLPGARLPWWRRGRMLGLVAAVFAAASLVGAVALAKQRTEAPAAAPAAARAMPALPPPWKVAVDVLNGAGDIVRTRQLASRVGGFGYTIRHVGRADRFDYPQTAVYYERGGRANAIRLARQLGVVTKPLPGGTNPRRLVVVVGPERGPGM